MKATSVAKSLAVGLALFSLLAADMTASPPAFAQSAAKGASGLPLPRFVSLKARRVNLRIGPSRDYAIEWLYTRSGIPMEIIQEYDHWRRVRDTDGTVGWIHKSLLTGDRTAVVAPWKRGEQNVYVILRENPQLSADMIAKMEPGVVVKIAECNGKWCRGEVQGTKGWVAQDEIWGVYPGEAFK
ncbi:MAG: SH3 domain-containing protein [Hyphomicrobiales bacterium]|nr:SH3 domain-containing protein [Hyphomicrobiales bacterium]MCP4999207.1 SH3 domain-containing protein [Hyphomicrobiales bacterium]